MKITNKQNLPAPIYEAVQANPYSRGTADISVTQLIDPPRLVALVEEHSDELESDAADLIWSLLGQAMHNVLERSGRKSGKGSAEQRLYAVVNDWTISGQYDYIDENNILWDWKFVSVWEYINGIRKSREEQLNTYAFLAASNNLKVNGLKVGFIFRDWSVTFNSPDYPKSQSVAVEIPLWSEADQRAFVEERVAVHQAARVALPECSEEERWARLPTWAVMKKGNKRAVRVFTTEAAAEGHAEALALSNGGQYYVEYRRGESVRCVSYCAALPWCEQGRSLL